MKLLSVYMYRQISKCTDKTQTKYYEEGSVALSSPLATLVIRAIDTMYGIPDKKN